MLECEIAALAAARRSDRDLRGLGAILDRASRQRKDPDAFIVEDLAFHDVLSRATQDELFVLLLASLAEVLTEVRLLGLRIPGTASRALRHHQQVLDAVRAADPDAARAAMDAHMDEATETLRQAVSGG